MIKTVQLTSNQKNAIISVFQQSDQGRNFIVPENISGQVLSSLVKHGLLEMEMKCTGEGIRGYCKIYRTSLEGNQWVEQNHECIKRS